MRRVGLALLAAALLLPLVPAPSTASHVGGMYGDALRIALQAPVDLNPLLFASNRLAQQVAYESLVRLGTDQLPRPWLATAWRPNPADSTIEMDLRTATWPDTGAAITPQDVAWSFQQHLMGGTAAGFTVAVLDANTVEFTFTSGGGDFLGNAATLPIAWRSGTNTPVTNGPFIFDAATATSLELVPSAGHWNGRPYIDRIAFLFPYTLALGPTGATQANDAACALMHGDVQLIGWTVSSIEQNTRRDCVASHGAWPDGTNRTLSDVERLVPFLGFVDSPALRVLELGMNTQVAPLDDMALRVAISRAVDRDLIATFIETGTDIADSPVSPANLEWFNDSVPRYRIPQVIVGTTTVPSLESVNAFLNDAGYLDTDGDGLRETPAGAPFSFVLHTLNQSADPSVAKYLDLEAKLRAIGLNLTRESHGFSDLRATVRSGLYDLFVDFVDTAGEPAFLFDQYHRDGADNLVRIDDPSLNAILETARDAIDPAVRRKAVRDAQGWIVTNAAVAPIVHMRAIDSYDKDRFEGWIGGLGGIANFWSFIAIHATQRGPMFVTVDPFVSALRSGSNTSVLVRVQDVTDNPVEGVELEFDATGLDVAIGSTDDTGTFFARFTAPNVTEPMEFPIVVTASKAGYVQGIGREAVTVHPPIRTVAVTLIVESSTMNSGGQIAVNVTVTDEGTALPVGGANVTFRLSPDGLGASFAQASGVTATDGTFETTFTADVAVESRFVITATVTNPGYETVRETRSVDVEPRSQGGVPPTPALDTISMIALVAGLAALYGWQQRRKWVERKP